MNKKGQMEFGIITFVIILIGLLIIAPVVLKTVRSTVTGMGDALNSSMPQASSQAYYIEEKFTSLWDMVLILAFVANIILLFVGAFFIDTHPVFAILYIMMIFFLMVFTPSMIDLVDEIWSQPAYSEETGLYLDNMDFVREHFSGLIFILALLSGVVLYGKIKLFPSY